MGVSPPTAKRQLSDDRQESLSYIHAILLVETPDRGGTDATFHAQNSHHWLLRQRGKLPPPGPLVAVAPRATRGQVDGLEQRAVTRTNGARVRPAPKSLDRNAPVRAHALARNTARGRWTVVQTGFFSFSITCRARRRDLQVNLPALDPRTARRRGSLAWPAEAGSPGALLDSPYAAHRCIFALL